MTIRKISEEEKMQMPAARINHGNSIDGILSVTRLLGKVVGGADESEGQCKYADVKARPRVSGS